MVERDGFEPSGDFVAVSKPSQTSASWYQEFASSPLRQAVRNFGNSLERRAKYLRVRGGKVEVRETVHEALSWRPWLACATGYPFTHLRGTLSRRLDPARGISHRATFQISRERTNRNGPSIYPLGSSGL
jgi:hypothetical protein